MGNRLKAFLTMGISSIIQVIINIIRTKLVAILLGTMGVGITSLLNNFVSTITSFTSLGLGNGIIKEISKQKHNPKHIKEVEITSYIITLILSIIAILAIFLFSKSISIQTMKDSSYSNYVIICSFAIPFITLNTLNLSVINGFSSIKNLAQANIMSSLVNLVISVILIYFLKLDGAIYAIFINSIITCIVYFIYGKKTFEDNNITYKFELKYFNLAVMRPLFKYGIVVIVTSLMTNIALLGVRSVILNNLGIDYNGIFQSIWALCNQYMLLILSSMGIYYLPKLCSKNSNSEIVNEMNETLNLVLKLVVPTILIVLNFRYFMIRALYSNEFLIAVEIIPLFLIGDFFKTIQWCICMPLYSIPKLKMQVLLEFIYDFILFTISFILIKKVGLLGIGFAYLFSQIVLVIIEYAYLKKIIDFKYTKSNIFLISVSFLVIFIPCIATYYLDQYLNYLISVLAIIIWSVMCIKKTEIMLFKNYISSKLCKSKGTNKYE